MNFSTNWHMLQRPHLHTGEMIWFGLDFSIYMACVGIYIDTPVKLTECCGVCIFFLAKGHFVVVETLFPLVSCRSEIKIIWALCLTLSIYITHLYMHLPYIGQIFSLQLHFWSSLLLVLLRYLLKVTLLCWATLCSKKLTLT